MRAKQSSELHTARAPTIPCEGISSTSVALFGADSLRYSPHGVGITCRDLSGRTDQDGANESNRAFFDPRENVIILEASTTLGSNPLQVSTAGTVNTQTRGSSDIHLQVPVPENICSEGRKSLAESFGSRRCVRVESVLQTI